MSGGSKKSVPDIPTESSYLGNPITEYKSKTGLYPSNAEVWWAYRRPLELGSDKAPKQYLEVFDPSLRHQISTGNTLVAKGHYILNAFFKDRSKASGVSGIATESAGGYRPTAVAFFAGRVFYAGVNVSKYNTKVYFSQYIERPEQVQYCYQALDPTDENIRDLLPTDGGEIIIPEVTEVYHLHPMGQSLFVFCRNGVWQISGSEGIGFRANDYSVTKISGTPALSLLSFVSVEGAPLWWNRDGIYSLSMNQVGMGQVQSLSEETIKSFYDDIPDESKFYAKGAYNPLTKRVQWLYRSTEATTEAEKFEYDRILNLDTRSGAFFPYSPADHDRVEIKGIFAAEGFSTSQEEENVTAGATNELVTANSEQVTVIVETKQPVQSTTKYIVNVLSEDDLPEPPAEA